MSPFEEAYSLLKAEVLLWPKKFDNQHWMMKKPGAGGFTLQGKKGDSKAFVSLPNLAGDYGKSSQHMTDEELQNAFLETDAHETMHETLGNIGEGYDKPLHNEYPAMVAEYLQYARRPREQIPSNDKVSQLLDEGVDDREIAMQVAGQLAPLHQQVSPGQTYGGIARVVTGPPKESYDDFQTGEPMDIAMRLLKMPLIPESVKETSPNQFEGQFYNPTTDKTHRLAGSRLQDGQGKYSNITLSAYPAENEKVDVGDPYQAPMTDREGTPIVGGTGFNSSPSGDLSAHATYLEAPYRRQGMGTAMYEMANTMAGQQQNIVPSNSQSFAAQEMWKNKLQPQVQQPQVQQQQQIQTGEPMDISMRLLKEEPIYLRNSAELAELARQGDEEAYDEMMRRLEDYYNANEITGETSMENNLDTYGMETGNNPYKRPLGYNPPNRHGNPVVIHQRPQTPIHPDKELHGWQYKNASEPMDITMRLLKEAIPVEPHSREQDDFKAFRTVPTSRVQQILLEGLQPLPLDKTHKERAGSDFSRVNYGLGIPTDNLDMEDFNEDNERRKRRGKSPIPLRPPQENAIWTFGKRSKFPKPLHEEMIDEDSHNQLTSPLLMAQHFGDKFVPSRPTSIIGSRVKPPGRIIEDREFGREQGIARPQASFRPIAPEHLEEVTPIDWDGNPISYNDYTLKLSEPMDIAMRLLKAPYDIDGEVYDQLYQGGREGDEDSGYWPSGHTEALTYALMGSGQDRGMRNDGTPQIRIAPETEEMHRLTSDPETGYVGIADKNAFPHEIQSREETAQNVEQLLSELKDDPYADDDDVDSAYNETQSDIAPFMDTGARDVSNAKRIAHIEEMLNRVRTGEPMDIAYQLLKAPMWYGDGTGGFERDEGVEQEPPYNPDFTMLEDMKGPMDPATSQQAWESEDGFARGIAKPDHEDGTWKISHFEVADDFQGLGNGETYLQEYIERLREDEEIDVHWNPYEIHVTHVDPPANGFWNKMVDRGVIHAAHETPWIRRTLNGENTFSHAYTQHHQKPYKS